MPAAWVSAAVGVVGAISSASAASDASDNAQQANANSATANANAAKIAQQQQDIANEQWSNYKTSYMPMEQSNLEQAKNYGSIANQEKASADAAAAAKASFGGARDALNKTPGLDPNSQQYLREANRLGISEAAASATGQTTARRAVADRGAAMLSDAASLGKGIAGSAVTSMNAAGLGANQASQIGAYTSNNAYNRSATANAGLGNMIGGLSQNKSVMGGITDLYNKIGGSSTPAGYTHNDTSFTGPAAPSASSASTSGWMSGND